jgi:formylglycine-generating enzyme required for sulfatase activity
MKRPTLLAANSLILLWLQAAAAAPLNDVQVKALLESGFSPEEVKAEVEKSGYAGPTDAATLGGLRKAGADAGLVALLLKGAADRRTETGEAEVPAQVNRNDAGGGNTGAFTGKQAGERKLLRVEGVEMALRWCPPGNFTMGSPKSEKDRQDDEHQVLVRLTQGFWLAETECTQGQWQAVMGSNPSDFKGPKLPVETVSWDDAQEFIAKMNGLKVLPTDWKWALPTEAQWEYACRAGTPTAFAFGDSLSSRQANFNGNYPYGGGAKGPYLKQTVDVGSYPANGWGLHDMHGNVWERCADWYGEKLRGGVDPTGVSTGTDRVFRGGGWYFIGGGCRSAYRSGDPPDSRGYDLGFRLAAVPAGR